MKASATLLFGALLSGAFSPAGAAAETIAIGMHVPVFCRAEVASTSGSGGGTTQVIGILQESCNNGSGYTVVVQHPEGIENAAFVLTGGSGAERVPLSPTGFTILTSSSYPNRQSRQLSIDLPEGQSVPSVSLSMQVGS